jgi:SAM-dependent methyltransferase
VADEQIWSDQSFLRNVQYADDANLVARQSIYAYQRPSLSIAALVLDSLHLSGDESIADIGCGNGRYLAELGSRGHRGLAIGLDASPGMLAAAAGRIGGLPGARLLAGDAAELPLRDRAIDAALAAHMLYHVPVPTQALQELRRVTRPGGQVAVVLNARDHLSELRGVIGAAYAQQGAVLRTTDDQMRLDQGAELLAGYFNSVSVHEFTSELQIPDAKPVVSYLRSISTTQDAAEQDRLTDAVTSAMTFDADGFFRVTTHWGCLIGR